jgi:hypothetical protein
MISVLFWDITQRRVVFVYRRFLFFLPYTSFHQSRPPALNSDLSVLGPVTPGTPLSSLRDLFPRPLPHVVSTLLSLIILTDHPV